ncbi:Aryl-alcohol oxidase [Mycena sanguinolenta]|uniref:Aryl-alcohol oxidase n=1 Tax=Mycena sanguinolenta TaxID=230812 RepID=A0A8H7DID2_9AGAR|nr:Aryl-alcohol oxidase [Mycena sanguinolenta]
MSGPQLTMILLSSILILALGTTLCSSTILDNVADLNKLNLKFDFIVVGGGTAGAVVGNRLSENPNNSVLVLEAGISDAGILDIAVPFYSLRVTPNTAVDWNYSTTAQVGLNGRSIAYPRGFVLGGSSSVNDMIYTRGSKEDYDRWANITGDDGWSWDQLIPYMRKNERFTPPSNETTEKFNPAVHGFNGINTVSLQGFPNIIDSRVIQTTTELAEFPFNLDMNSGYPLGIGWQQQTVKNGSRSSSATSYFAPQFISRPNLQVLLHARVTRVLQTNSNNTFRTVEFVQDLAGEKFTLTAEKEVILSAGSIGTPNILLHSGIGNSTTLSSLGINAVHDLPSVGQNLTDHPLISISFLVNSSGTWEDAERNATLAAEQLAQWNATKTGPLIDSIVPQLGWFRIPDNSSIFGQVPDPSAGPNTPHYELIFISGLFGVLPPTGNFMGVVPAVVSPTSRGSVTLESNDTLSNPLIDPNLLSSDYDLFVMREAIKSALRFATPPAWQNFVISPFNVNSTYTDGELDNFIRENAGTIFHPSGTAKMSPKDAAWGVVDPDLSVKGLSGLRAVDLSIAPLIPAAHTQAAAYIIGERGSDLIKEAWGQI